MIELIDDQFKRILDVLDEAGQRENTLIIYMSDHGELLGDHGLIYKGCRFFESLVHVPLIISWPDRALRGVRSDALVELVDLAPTLLEAAGLEITYHMQGKSLLPLLTGQKNLHHHKDHVTSEYHDALAAVPTHSHATMYFEGRCKLVICEGEDVGELFDLKSDLVLRHLRAYSATSGAGVRHG